jgi:CH-like domain in sperm protein
MMDAPPVSEDELAGIYTWVDEFQLSKPKRNISRDFADGLLVAEIIHHLMPKYIELHNYSQASAAKEKYYNWNTLNSKITCLSGF